MRNRFNQLFSYSFIKKYVLALNALITIFTLIVFYKFAISSYNIILNTFLYMRGKDMQWFPSVLLWNHINPFHEFLFSNNTFLTQAPNYGHLIYLLFYPLTLISYENATRVWAITSFVAFISSFLLLIPRNKYKFILSIIFLHSIVSGYTFANVLDNGQFTFICAFSIAIAYIYRKNLLISSVFLTIVSIKYTFGITVLIGFFISGYRKASIIAALISLVSPLIIGIILDIPYFEALLWPIKIGVAVGVIGPADLMSLGRILGYSLFEFNIITLTIASLLLFYSYICYKFKEILGDEVIIGSSILISYPLMFHLGYDYALLYVPLLILLKKIDYLSASYASIAIISISLWKVISIFERFNIKIASNYSYAMNMGIEYSFFYISLFLLAISGLIYEQIYRSNHRV